MTWALIGGGATALLGFLWILVKSLRTVSEKKGSLEASLDAQKKIDKQALETRDQRLEDIQDVKEIATKLDTDPEYANRVRERFSRD